MLDRRTLRTLGSWNGYRLDRVAWRESRMRTVELHLKPAAKVMYCQRCGARCTRVHETAMRRPPVRVTYLVEPLSAGDRAAGQSLQPNFFEQPATKQSQAATAWAGRRYSSLIRPTSRPLRLIRSGSKNVIWPWMRSLRTKGTSMPLQQPTPHPDRCYGSVKGDLARLWGRSSTRLQARCR